MVDDNSQTLNINNSSSDIEIALLSKKKSLVERLNEIEAEESKIKQEFDAKIANLTTTKKRVQQLLFHIEALLDIDGHIVSQNNKEPSDFSPSPSTQSITDMVFTILNNTHKPTHYKDLTSKLLSEKVPIPGRDPNAILLSRINRDPRFKRTNKRGVYALAEWRVVRGAKRSKRPSRRKK